MRDTAVKDVACCSMSQGTEVPVREGSISACEGGEHDNDAAVKDVAVRNTRKMTETIRAGEDCHGGHCAPCTGARGTRKTLHNEP